MSPTHVKLLLLLENELAVLFGAFKVNLHRLGDGVLAGGLLRLFRGAQSCGLIGQAVKVSDAEVWIRRYPRIIWSTRVRGQAELDALVHQLSVRLKLEALRCGVEWSPNGQA